jgi:hypothetical protein
MLNDTKWYKIHGLLETLVNDNVSKGLELEDYPLRGPLAIQPQICCGNDKKLADGEESEIFV